VFVVQIVERFESRKKRRMIFVKNTKNFAKITREAPGFFGGPSSLDHEDVISIEILSKSGSVF